MTWGVTHAHPGEKHPDPSHEHRPLHEGHGYSVQSSVLQSSGRPEEIPGAGNLRLPMTRFDSDQDGGDYRISSYDRGGARGTSMAAAEAGQAAVEDAPEPFRQPAGYDLQGIGGAEIKDTQPTAPPTMGRQTRKVTPLFTHEGEEQRGSDYSHPNDRGFRYRNREAT